LFVDFHDFGFWLRILRFSVEGEVLSGDLKKKLDSSFPCSGYWLFVPCSIRLVIFEELKEEKRLSAVTWASRAGLEMIVCFANCLDYENTFMTSSPSQA